MNHVLGAALLVMLALLGLPAYGQPHKAIWSGRSGDVTVTWTQDDIIARRQHHTVFSARTWANVGLRHFVDASRVDGKVPDCDYTRAIRIVSLVGTLLSLRDETAFTCRQEAHPGGMTRLITFDLASPAMPREVGADAIGQIDLRHPGPVVLLNRLASPAMLRDALLKSQQIIQVLPRDRAHPDTLAGLLDAVADVSGPVDQCYIIPSDLPAWFAIERVDGPHVVIALGLPGDGSCRMKLTLVPIELPMPPALAAALTAAAEQKAGFLADVADRLARGQATIIRLQTGRGAH